MKNMNYRTKNYNYIIMYIVHNIFKFYGHVMIFFKSIEPFSFSFDLNKTYYSSDSAIPYRQTVLYLFEKFRTHDQMFVYRIQ